MPDLRIIVGDALAGLSEIDDQVVQCAVTSPPYWGLRDYGNKNQLGLEATPEEYVWKLVAILRELRRTLRDDGVLWLNLGDSYATTTIGDGRNREGFNARLGNPTGPGKQAETARLYGSLDRTGHGLKPKDLVGIPWRVAFALQADGWYLRAESN